MAKIIETITDRVNSVKGKIIVFGITIIAAVTSYTGEYYVNPDERVYNLNLTGYEYSQLKTELLGIMRGRNTVKPTLHQTELWKSIATKELQKCGGWTFTNPVMINGKLDIEEINKKIENGC